MLQHKNICQYFCQRKSFAQFIIRSTLTNLCGYLNLRNTHLTTNYMYLSTPIHVLVNTNSKVILCSVPIRNLSWHFLQHHFLVIFMLSTYQKVIMALLAHREDKFRFYGHPYAQYLSQTYGHPYAQYLSWDCLHREMSDCTERGQLLWTSIYFILRSRKTLV